MIAFAKYLFDKVFLAVFAYLIFAAGMVLMLNGYTARISFEGFLIPHASKVLLWSTIAILVLRPRFGWKFPFTVLLLYCAAELVTNWIYVVVHLISDPTYLPQWIGVWNNNNYYFILSNAFFILGVILANVFLRNGFSLKKDWSMLPFAAFIGFWVATGYVTDSTMLYAAPGIELEEFLWSVLYLFVVWTSFHPLENRRPIPSLNHAIGKEG